MSWNKSDVMLSEDEPLRVDAERDVGTDDASMPLIEIFVWDAGLDLPSIEPECIATLAYLKQHERDLPAHSIVVGNESSRSPTGDYPYMQCSADICHEVCLAGFDQIVNHLNHEHFYDYPSPQDKSQAAQETALSAYIQTKGRQLLDLYLYVSYDNYYSTTSAAWTAILPWYENYVTPPAKRKAAQARTEHLGVTSLDVDNVHDMPLTGRRFDKTSASPAVQAVGTNSAAAAMIADSERRKRVQVLDKAAHSDVFRLRRLADVFFSALDTEVKKQDRSYFSAREARSVEYLMLGYLSLMKHSLTNNKWLADILTVKYPELATWTDSFFEQSFGYPAHEATKRRQPRNVAARGNGYMTPFRVLGYAILEHVPVLNLFVGPEITVSKPRKYKSTKASQRLSIQQTSVWRSATIIGLALAATATLVVINNGFWSDIVEFRTGVFFDWLRRRMQKQISAKQRSILNDMGEAGGFLSALGNQMYFESSAIREQERLGGARVAEVNIESRL